MRDNWHIWRVSHFWRFAICCTPRCASTSTMMWFASVHAPEHRILTNGDWLGQEARRQVAAEFYTLALLRDPWSRLVSAYLGKVVAHQRLAGVQSLIQNVRDLLGKSSSYDEGITFRQFVYATRMITNDHWRPCIDFIEPVNPTRTATPFTIVFELKKLVERCGMEHVKIIDLPNENAATYGSVVDGAFDMMPVELRALPKYPRWDSFYDDALKLEVRDRYRADIDRYGLDWQRAMLDLHGKPSAEETKHD